MACLRKKGWLWYGLVTVGLRDMWCCLNCVTLSLNSFSWMISPRLKKYMLTLPSVTASRVFFFFFYSAWLICTSTCARTHEGNFQGQPFISACKNQWCSHWCQGSCLEAWQIYLVEWTVSEELEQIHKHWIALSPSHTSGHKPVNVPIGKDLWWVELLPSTQAFYIRHPPTPKPSVCYLPGLVSSSGILYIAVFLRGIAVGFLAVLASLCRASREWPSPGATLWNWSVFLPSQHKPRPAGNKRVATHSVLAP